MAGSKNCPLPSAPAASPEARLSGALLDCLWPRLQADPLDAACCVALSGGRDSVVLLHVLHRLVVSRALPLRFSAVHVHHAISPCADHWADFCGELCRRLEIPFSVRHIDVPRSSGEGLEAAARRARYAVFSSLPDKWLLLAHHRRDQAETVLLNLLRGCGSAGAAGMREERRQNCGPRVIRPWLDVSPGVIQDYAREHGLLWIEDESNADSHFRRNYLRHHMLPKLERHFPGSERNLARAAGNFAECTILLADLACIDRAAVASASGRLDLGRFNALSPARARNLLRYEWLAGGRQAPEARWVEEALQQLARADTLSATELSSPEGQIRVYRGEVYISDPLAPPSSPLEWSGESALPWSGGLVRFEPASGAGIALSSLTGVKPVLKVRQGGERIQLQKNRPRRSLRNLLQEMGVPPWERDRLPCLWSGDELLWVGGLGQELAYACPAGEPGLLPVWQP
jgi:tRNA(Ile)-lysidine synthase